MTRNYDTTNHQPYPRVTKIEISYSESGSPVVRYQEQMSVVDGNNQVQHLATQATSHFLDLSQITEPVPLVVPSTGAVIPGQSVTTQQMMLGLLAFMRADQLRRDADAVETGL